ncbi:hypothetical protein HUU05_30450 [candidate division KSB1 bacterium]|nr:hypothetical protein [candidate division KSB1 bacterium]
MEESDKKTTKFFAKIGAAAVLILILGSAAAFFYFKAPFAADFFPLIILFLFASAVDLAISPGVFFVGIINSTLHLQMTEAQIFTRAVPTCIVAMFILSFIVDYFNEPKKITNKEFNLKMLKAYGAVYC